MATIAAIPNLGRSVREFPINLSSIPTFVQGSLVSLTAGNLVTSGTNPTAIVGFAAGPATVPDVDVNPGRRLAFVATPESTFWMEVRGLAGAVVDVTTLDAGAQYGVTHDADAIAFVDTTKTSAALQRVVIERIDEVRNMVEVRILPEYRVFPTAANVT